MKKMAKYHIITLIISVSLFLLLSNGVAQAVNKDNGFKFPPINEHTPTDLEILDSYFNPIVGYGAYGPAIANNSNYTAVNIKLTVTGEGDLFDVFEETAPMDTLVPNESMHTKYILTPKMLGNIKLQYVLEWEDDVGSKYSINNKDKPIDFYVEIMPPPTTTTTSFSSIQMGLVVSGVAIIAIFVVYYLIMRKNSKKTPSNDSNLPNQNLNPQ